MPSLTLSLPWSFFYYRLSSDRLRNWRWKQKMAVMMVPKKKNGSKEEGSCSKLTYNHNTLFGCIVSAETSVIILFLICINVKIF